ncbi:hypothetical protein [Alkalibacillus aidingensis]|uniref:hypothetical protein n=1 Tax=Alkalibacillus aidingensis TaxID=2747607 RepID=UPI001660BA93|nr:hypothetical protein [Alkalibacillus aidingensis]
MTLQEVLNQLNDGILITEVAKRAGIDKEQKLSTKLQNAAIVYNEQNNQWNYIGNSPSISLSREVNKPIKLLKVDRPFVSREEKHQRTNPKEHNDKNYELYANSISVDYSLLKEKKTFFLTEEMYKTLKVISKERSLKINVLIDVLLSKGLEYYNFDQK